MEMITITLDGAEVSGYPGMTVLELAKESGVDIPTLCYDCHLTPSGACRLCLVEEEHTGALLASCVSPIRAGMVINTKSQRVMERRKIIVQLMLASHPDSCLVCDKGNRCQLRKIATEMGIGTLKFRKIPQAATIEEVNPLIERDLSKCILCAKCIRADQELVVEGAIDYMARGFTAKPATLAGLPLEKSECTFCGTCVALCPTGALMEKEKIYHGTTTKTTNTTCPFCGCGCSLCLEVKDNRLVRAKPGDNSSVNKGTLCIRGSYGYDYVHSPERLTRPLIKIDNNFQAVSWEQALVRTATEFHKIKKKYGPDSLAILGSSKCTNEENYLLQRLARAVLGTNSIDNGSRLYSSASRLGLGWTIGFPGSTNSLNELEKSDVIVVIGANPDSSAPAVGYAIKRASRYAGAKLLLVDPRKTKLASFAHLWLRPKTGTDVALLNGMAKVIIDEKLHDEEFVDLRTDNFAELTECLKLYTPKYVSEITGVSVEDIELAARLVAKGERASFVFGNGLCQRKAGTDSVLALANLVMLTGNIGQRGGGIFALQQENNAQGACDMGSLPDFLPGYQSLEDAQVRKSFEERWQVSLPTNAGLTAQEMIEQAAAGKIRGILIVGENPLSSFPKPSLLRKAFASIDFLVVADMFLTETAKLATVVLPAAGFAEKEGTFTNFEGRVQPVRKAIEPPGESLADFEIILRLADKMGNPMPYSSPQQVMNEISDLVPLYGGPASTDSETEEPDISSKSDYLNARRLYGGLFPHGFGRFSPVEFTPPTKGSRDGYPLALCSGSILPHFGSGTRSSRASRLKKFSPRGWVEVSETDAKQFGLSEGDTVRVVSPVGEVTSRIRITDTLPPGMLFLPKSFPECPVNELFDVVLDDRSKAPSVKECAVRLERIVANV